MIKLVKGEKYSGFTLIEIMVAVSIFVIVALVVTIALYTVIQAWKEAQTIKLLTDNLSFAFDSMITKLHDTPESDYIGIGTFGNLPADDRNGSDSLGRFGYTGVLFKPLGQDWVAYALLPVSAAGGKTIAFCQDNSSDGRRCFIDQVQNYRPLLSPDLNVPDLRFYIYEGDKHYRRILIFGRAEATIRGRKIIFPIQTTIAPPYSS